MNRQNSKGGYRRSTFALCCGLALFACGWWLGRSTAGGSSPERPEAAPAAARATSSLSDGSEAKGVSQRAQPAAKRSLSRNATSADPLSSLRQLEAKPASRMRDRAMVSEVKRLARMDPPEAIEFAESQQNSKTRRELLLAAIEGWGEIDAESALTWIEDLPAREREAAFARLAQGAASAAPDALLSLARAQMADGKLSRTRGFAVLSALTERGEHEAAFRLIEQPEASAADRKAWTLAAYQGWAEYRPEEAAEHALARQNPQEMRAAFDAVVLGWAQTQPASLAQFAEGLPPGRERSYALSESLRQWVDQDPLAVADWLDRVEPSPDLDVGVLALAINPYLGERRPDVAASWAESLHDPHQRTEALGRIVRQWAASDKSAAFRYVEASAALPAAAREELLSLLAPR